MSKNASIPTILVESFSRKDKPIPNRCIFSLGNHVGNVVRLVRAGLDDFQDNTLRTPRILRVLKAAKAHDMGKPQKFNIEVKTTAKGKFKVHLLIQRASFLATSSDAWAESLAKDIMISLSVKLAGTYALKSPSMQTFWLKSLCLCP